jgi:hypothetical protein
MNTWGKTSVSSHKSGQETFHSQYRFNFSLEKMKHDEEINITIINVPFSSWTTDKKSCNVLTLVAHYASHRAHTKIEGNDRLAGG